MRACFHPASTIKTTMLRIERLLIRLPADLIGGSPSWVSHIMNLLNLKPEIQAGVLAGEMMAEEKLKRVRGLWSGRGRGYWSNRALDIVIRQVHIPRLQTSWYFQRIRSQPPSGTVALSRRTRAGSRPCASRSNVLLRVGSSRWWPGQRDGRRRLGSGSFDFLG